MATLQNLDAERTVRTPEIAEMPRLGARKAIDPDTLLVEQLRRGTPARPRPSWTPTAVESTVWRFA